MSKIKELEEEVVALEAQVAEHKSMTSFVIVMAIVMAPFISIGFFTSVSHAVDFVMSVNDSASRIEMLEKQVGRQQERIQEVQYSQNTRWIDSQLCPKHTTCVTE